MTLQLREEIIRQEEYDKGNHIGKLEGRREGKLEGKLEGKFEEKLEIAKKMLEKNISVEDIIIFTNLSKEEILKLKD